MSLPFVVTDLPQGQERQHRTLIAITVNELVKSNTRGAMPPVTYGASIAFDSSTGSSFIVTATNNTPFTIEAPLNGVAGQRLLVVIKNASGGALGAITWNAVFKKTAFTNPANGFSRCIEFLFDGTNWIQVFQSTVDVPN